MINFVVFFVESCMFKYDFGDNFESVTYRFNLLAYWFYVIVFQKTEAIVLYTYYLSNIVINIILKKVQAQFFFLLDFLMHWKMLGLCRILRRMAQECKDLATNIYSFKINNRNTRKREICSKLTIKRPQRRQLTSIGVFIKTVNIFRFFF